MQKHIITGTAGGKKLSGSRKRERGASIFEAMVALCFMCFLFFALLQICQWCNAKLFCRYASYFGAKGRALGYKDNFTNRAVRVAALPVSGPSLGFRSGNELSDAQNYMVDGDKSGVWYKYWYPQRETQPEIRLSGRADADNVEASVTLRNAPLIAEQLGKLMGISRTPSPSGKSTFYNYSSVYLE